MKEAGSAPPRRIHSFRPFIPAGKTFTHSLTPQGGERLMLNVPRTPHSKYHTSTPPPGSPSG